MTSIWADVISISRIVLAYPLYLCMMSSHHVLTCVMLGWIMISDMLDGLVARHYGSSVLGRWVDPFADAVAVFAWVLGLLKMKILTWPWVAFWSLRYIFFGVWAIWVKYRHGYYISAGVWNKISIFCLSIFLVFAWWRQTVAIEFGVVLILCQLMSIWETLIATPPQEL